MKAARGIATDAIFAAAHPRASRRELEVLESHSASYVRAVARWRLR